MMNSLDGIWRLTIEKEGGTVVCILASHEILNSELNDWVEFCSSDNVIKEQTSEHARTVHGIHDTADRAENVIAYRFAEVIGMSIVRMY